jgi:type I restriction enzyme S subunit
VEWLRKIPKDWFKIKFGITNSKAELGGNYAAGEGEKGLPLIKMGNLGRGFIQLQKVEYLLKDETYDKEHMLKEGDFLFNTRNSMSLVGKVCVWRKELKQALFNSNILKITFRESLISSTAFMNYLFNSDFGLNQLQLIAKGTTNVAAIYYKDLASLFFCLPPATEQSQIANFLDHETAKIDTLIKKQQQLIALLKEKRQAVISHAVTKGLNPGAPMKDSGVEWLGEVPEHWEVTRLKYHIDLFEQGWSPQCDSRKAEGREYGVLKVGCVNGGQFDRTENKALPEDFEPRLQYLLQKSDFLISRANTKELVGSAAVVDKDYDRLILCDKLYRLRFKDTVNPQLIAFFMTLPIVRQQIELGATGASHSMQNIGQSTIKELPVVIPSIPESKTLVLGIQNKIELFDSAIYKAGQQITLLQERRTALISAAVTGKIDVRNWQPPTPTTTDKDAP